MAQSTLFLLLFFFPSQTTSLYILKKDAENQIDSGFSGGFASLINTFKVKTLNPPEEAKESENCSEFWNKIIPANFQDECDHTNLHIDSESSDTENATRVEQDNEFCVAMPESSVKVRIVKKRSYVLHKHRKKIFLYK